jgi:RNA-binding protein
MQDWCHATPSENGSPAGKAQNCRATKRQEVERRVGDAGFDEDHRVWFQDTEAACNLYNPPMELSERQRKYLRGLGHALNPVILIGQHGVTPAVVAETRRALDDHELIKVKFRGAEREERDAGLNELASATESVLLQRIGHTALYYKRRNDRPGIVIPDA